MAPKFLQHLLLGVLALLAGAVTSSLGAPLDASSSIETSDSCDWEGSGLTDHGSDRVVVPIYLRCTQGTVKWVYPKNALQVILKQGPSLHPEFRGCIRIAGNATAKVRIYVEGVYQSLHKLYSYDDGKPRDLVRCFVSHGGQAALYMESEQTVPNYTKELFQLNYHLEAITSKKALHDDQDECRPCSDREMHTFFCTSDFIIRGTISSMYNNERLERTELRIKTSQVTKSLYSVVSPPLDGHLSNHKSTSDDKYVVLHRPAKCHSKAGIGSEFLFLGHWVLGNPIIKCAPKVSYWKHVKSRAIASAANQCQLN